MSLLRFLGLGSAPAGRESEPESLVELSRHLDDRSPEEARLVAAFAYLLARVAGTDLEMQASERTAIKERLEGFGGIEAAEAELLAEAAIQSADALGATDDHLVTRAFRDMSDAKERLRLLRCLYAVAAADQTISGREDNEIFEIAKGLGVSRTDVLALRVEWKSYLGSMRTLPGER